MSATENVTEEALEIAEQAMDALEETFTFTRSQYLFHMAVAGAVAGAAVGTLAYYVSKRQLKTKYEQIAQQEIAEAKDFYRALNKQGEFETPEKAVRALSSEDVVDEAIDKASDALREYQGEDGEDPEEVEEEVVVESSVNVFVESHVDDDFDFETEMAKRTPDKPYIIHETEFLQAEPEFTQTSITYYEGDGTLADDQDQEIPFVEPIVGAENLQRFGHGSGDPRVVYVRNERLSTDFEVLLSDGKYAHEVLGFEHADGGARGRRVMNRPRKFRGEDE